MGGFIVPGTTRAVFFLATIVSAAALAGLDNRVEALSYRAADVVAWSRGRPRPR